MLLTLNRIPEGMTHQRTLFSWNVRCAEVCAVQNRMEAYGSLPMPMP